MDPITIATTYATIVSLICAFKQERKEDAILSKEDFVSWLEEHRHNELKNIINKNNCLGEAINDLLNENHAEVMGKLEYICKRVEIVSSKIDGLGQIVYALDPKGGSGLSTQAISILKQLVHSQGENFQKVGYIGGSMFLHLQKGGNITYDEPRFLDDDLNNLCELGLLRLDYTSQGNEIFRVTRNAVEYINQLTAE